MKENSLAQARFNPKVKQYWLVFWILLSVATLILVPLLPFIILLVLLVSQRMLDAMSAELYERKLVVKYGVLFRTEKSIPLEKITDLGMIQGPVMRVFGIHRLTVETAGQSGAGALVSLLGVIDVEDFREQVLTQKDVITGRPASLSSENIEENPQQAMLKSLQNIEQMLKHYIENKAP